MTAGAAAHVLRPPLAAAGCRAADCCPAASALSPGRQTARGRATRAAARSAAEIERRHAEEIREGAARLARGEAPPRRRFSEQHRDRLRQAALDAYLARVMDDPHAPPLRRLRASKGLSADALADLANVGVRTVFRAEIHPQNTSARTWRRLADALGVEPSEIRP